MMRFFRSNDTRLRSDFYINGGRRLCCLIEKTQNGMLITELNERGLVEKQVYMRPDDPFYVNLTRGMEIIESGDYKGMNVDAACTSCNGILARELDLIHPSVINTVPVVPSYICKGCSKRFYSMTDTYLKSLVADKKELFDEKDLKELSVNEEVFVSTLQEYIIRIFASKKISRIR
jgi:hypothetical protein